MNIIVSNFNINNITVWLIKQPLYCFQKEQPEPIQDGGFLCYFKFSSPYDFHEGEMVNFTEGELIMDGDRKPKIFLIEEEIELFAMNYIKKKINL